MLHVLIGHARSTAHPHATAADARACQDRFTAEVDDAGWAEREYMDRYAPVASLSDAHSHWHAVNGRFAVCPLDCGAGEGFDDYGDADDSAAVASLAPVWA